MEHKSHSEVLAAHMQINVKNRNHAIEESVFWYFNKNENSWNNQSNKWQK